jgi:hypothetical protein
VPDPRQRGDAGTPVGTQLMLRCPNVSRRRSGHAYPAALDGARQRTYLRVAWEGRHDLLEQHDDLKHGHLIDRHVAGRVVLWMKMPAAQFVKVDPPTRPCPWISAKASMPVISLK